MPKPPKRTGWRERLFGRGGQLKKMVPKQEPVQKAKLQAAEMKEFKLTPQEAQRLPSMKMRDFARAGIFPEKALSRMRLIPEETRPEAATVVREKKESSVITNVIEKITEFKKIRAELNEHLHYCNISPAEFKNGLSTLMSLRQSLGLQIYYTSEGPAFSENNLNFVLANAARKGIGPLQGTIRHIDEINIYLLRPLSLFHAEVIAGLRKGR